MAARLAIPQVGCTHLAADLVQDTFERLLKRESYGDVEKSGAYLKPLHVTL